MDYRFCVAKVGVGQGRFVLSEHASFVDAQLRRFGASVHELADLSQEVWLIALARSPSFSERRAARAWLTQVCRRVAASERRTRARTPLSRGNTPEIEVEARQSAHVERQFDDLAGLEALSQLAESQRDVLSLYGSGELSMREVAWLLRVPEGTVFSRYRAALAEAQRALRRVHASGAKPAPEKAAGPAHALRLDDQMREARVDAGEFHVYRGDGDGVFGRMGNVVVTRWRRRMFSRTFEDVGLLLELAHTRLRMPVLLVNDGDLDVKLPNAAERATMRSHLAQHSHRVAMAVDVFNTPVTRFAAAIVQGGLLITRAPTRFVMVPSLEAAERWVRPYARSNSGAIPWSKVREAVVAARERP